MPLPCEQPEASESIVSMVPVVNDVDETGVLEPTPTRLLVDDNYTKKYNEFYEFLDKWAVDHPGSV